MKRLANVLLDDEGPREVQARCEAARISPSTYHGLVAGRDFLRWLHERAQQHVTNRLWEVRLHHLRLALAGNLQAIKLFYDLYDPDGSGARAARSDEDIAEAFVNLVRLAADTPLGETDDQ